jgi:bla regulator protein BlaR1
MSAAYFSAIGNHLWQSTLFVGLAGLLTLAFRKNRARVRHGIWLAASCKFLFPLSALVALGGQVRWRTAEESIPSNFAMVAEAGRRLAAPAISPRTPAESSSTGMPVVLAAIWACGFVGIACTWWIRWGRIRRVVRVGSPLPAAIPLRAVSSSVLAEPGVFGLFRPVLILPEGICERLTGEQLDAVIAHEMCHVGHRDNLTAALHMAVETVFWFHPLVW